VQYSQCQLLLTTENFQVIYITADQAGWVNIIVLPKSKDF